MANAKDNENSTPLHAASQEGKLNVVEILVRIEKLRRRFPLIHYYDYQLSQPTGSVFFDDKLPASHWQQSARVCRRDYIFTFGNEKS